MKTQAVLSVLGRDRVGIADDLGAALTHRKIDIEDIRMTALKGRFALIAQVSGERSQMTGLQEDLASLGSSLGFHVELEPIASKRPRKSPPQFLIESFSSGPSGMSAVTAVLKTYDVNIEDLKTKACAAPWTSGMTFHMTASITMPPTCSVAELRAELRELEHQRDLDVVIRPKPALVGDDSTTTGD
jgi:glycine cleavage system regulatory protein